MGDIRKYDQARVQAELEGKTQYEGAPCGKNPNHILPNGTTMRDTVKYRCNLCRSEQNKRRNSKRRSLYAKTKA